MKEDILEYLLENKTGDKIELNAFLIKILKNNNQKILQPVLESLRKEELVDFEGTVGWIGSPKHELENEIFKGALTGFGIQEAKEIKRRKRQDELLEVQTHAIWKTNAMNEQIGQSTIKLNEEIIPSNNRLQRNLGYRTLFVAGISTIAIVASVYFSSKGVTSKDIKRIDTLLQRNTQLLDSIVQFHRGIDSSLLTMANDSIKNVLLNAKQKTD